MSGSHWMMGLICDGLGIEDWVILAQFHVSFISRRLVQACFYWNTREDKKASRNAYPLFPTSS